MIPKMLYVGVLGLDAKGALGGEVSGVISQLEGRTDACLRFRALRGAVRDPGG